MPAQRILVVDDDRDACDLLQFELSRHGYDVTCCLTAAEALPRFSDMDFDVVLTDLAMGGMNGLELCERIVECHPEVPVVVLTGNGRLETAVAAFRVGAYDYITKPPEPEAMRLALNRAAEHHRLQSEVRRLRTALSAAERFGELEGKSAPMLRLYDLLQRAAETDASILILGESGTGKELAARGLHLRSQRKDRPFVAVNCAALPESLLESELFGHTRGAFTDALADHEGLLVGSRGGTVFLDEVGDMPLSLQPKLLRAIQERTVRPVGGRQEVPFNARIIAATHRNLAMAVEAGTFRADLYFRLNVIEIDLPPLRARGGDILQLAQGFVGHFARQMARPVTGFTTAVAQRLLDYRWTGNVRELKNCIERGVALTRSSELTVDDLPPVIQAFSQPPAAPSVAVSAGPLLPLKTVEREHIERVLSSVGGNKQEAARILGVNRRTLYRKLGKWAPTGPV